MLRPYIHYLFIVVMQVMTVVRDKGSLAPLADKNLSESSGVDAAAAAVAARKSVDSGPSRTPSSLAFFLFFNLKKNPDTTRQAQKVPCTTKQAWVCMRYIRT